MGSSLNKGNFGLMARPEFTSVAQLKGKKIGVARVGDVPYSIQSTSWPNTALRHATCNGYRCRPTALRALPF